jgi:hypothetical protein
VTECNIHSNSWPTRGGTTAVITEIEEQGLQNTPQTRVEVSTATVALSSGQEQPSENIWVFQALLHRCSDYHILEGIGARSE